MAQIAVIPRKCTGCGACAEACPFGAIDLAEGKAEINAACRVCGLCLKACPEKAIIRLETRVKGVDKSKWRGILVFAEQTEGRLHPVSLELAGKALELVEGTGHPVHALLIGSGCEASALELSRYVTDSVCVYDDPSLGFFRAEAFAACMEDAIRKLRPSVVLVGATSLGRSLAPRVSTRFRTGLTADCTKLELRENSDLVQVRPAFGGNIMAQIVTPHTRPQFATVRYKVMDAPQRGGEPKAAVLPQKIPKAVHECRVRLVRSLPVPKAANISEAEILVVGGRGLKQESDLQLIRELASLLGGEYAVSRPLVEKGWAPNTRQIGLSGRTVRPKLIITCGVSGAIQFTACMNAAEHIVSINLNPEAPIFQAAHVCIVGDLYRIVPELIARVRREESQYAAV